MSLQLAGFFRFIDIKVMIFHKKNILKSKILSLFVIIVIDSNLDRLRFKRIYNICHLLLLLAGTPTTAGEVYVVRQ